jgi:undecaprenyl diphosphate synthase
MRLDQDASRQSRSAAAPPRHVGVIMDGNGRWAAARGLPRFEGHRRGVEAVRRAVRAAIDTGVRYLTVYSFSTENWRRPPDEVADLIGLLKRFIRNDLADLHRNGVRVRVIGARDDLAGELRQLLTDAEQLTKDNDRLTLVVAFNYGGRQEILEAARRLARLAAAGELDPSTISQQTLSAALHTVGIPDPDLIIRTSGEQRLSNFLLWQAAYAEFVFLPIHWPDFDRAAFDSALAQFANRDRRYGGVASAAAPVVLAAASGS